MADEGDQQLSSRIIVKALPRKFKESRFREIFSECGQVTDCKLMMTESGTFRRFGFIGFEKHSEAETAVKRFDSSFIKGTRIIVELAKPYRDDSIAQPWSKYSKGSHAYSKLHPEEKVKRSVGKEEANSRPTSTLTSVYKEMAEMQEDPGFREFLESHSRRSSAKVWTNDDILAEKKALKKAAKKWKKSKEGTPGASVTTDAASVLKKSSKHSSKKSTTAIGKAGTEDDDIAMDEAEEPKSALDYLKRKVVKGDEMQTELSSSSSSGSESEQDSEDSDALRDHQGSSADVFTVKMLGLPFTAKPQDIHQFFHPLEVGDIRLTKDNQDRPSGRGYVDFSSEKDLQEALRRNGDYIKRRYIELFRDDGPIEKDPEIVEDVSKLRPWELKLLQSNGEEDEEEDVSETGRLFVRNLSYTCSEEKLSELFAKYGPVSDIELPLDKETNKVVGYAFVTFMFPEHAVKAFADCDGTIFLGRLLHILPAKPKGDPHKDADDGDASYKRQKAKETKKSASSGHNWNTLFLGSNAVADSMAQRYDTEKSDILGTEGSHSVAVRMALGETQLVSEVRDFLESHGVNLDTFSQSGVARSNTAFLVKNLPFGTKNEELTTLFSPFGTLAEVLLPQGGITAIVEFSEAGHAKAAFRSLAYTKFKRRPLYLEWAPKGVIDPSKKKIEPKQPSSQEEEEQSSDVVQATIFVKNLNFSTQESSLEELFSQVGPLLNVSVARKTNTKDPAKLLSMGFGFVEFESPSDAKEAIKTLQEVELDGHKLQLKMSNRETIDKSSSARKRVGQTKQTGAKILVRNIPFEASKHEVGDLFRTFGEIKILRLPKKSLGSQGGHRGFAFVEYTTKESATKAFKSLSLSTHFYNRRLVLEWAEDDDSVEAIRKRTAEQFLGTKPPKRKSRQVAQDLLFSLESTANEEDNAMD